MFVPLGTDLRRGWGGSVHGRLALCSSWMGTSDLVLCCSVFCADREPHPGAAIPMIETLSWRDPVFPDVGVSSAVSDSGPGCPQNGSINMLVNFVWPFLIISSPSASGPVPGTSV